jgi:hypothetical protein
MRKTKNNEGQALRKIKAAWYILVFIFFFSLSLFFLITVPRRGEVDEFKITLLEGEVQRRVLLTIPREVWLGNTTSIQVDILPIAGSSPNSIKPDTNSVLEARIDFSGMLLDPDGSISTPINPFHPINFTWKILPVDSGLHVGKLWLFINKVSVMNGDIQRQALVARDIEINILTLLGIPAIYLKIGSIAGITLSTIGLIILMTQYMISLRYSTKK